MCQALLGELKAEHHEMICLENTLFTTTPTKGDGRVKRTQQSKTRLHGYTYAETAQEGDRDLLGFTPHTCPLPPEQRVRRSKPLGTPRHLHTGPESTSRVSHLLSVRFGERNGAIGENETLKVGSIYVNFQL